MSDGIIKVRGEIESLIVGDEGLEELCIYRDGDINDKILLLDLTSAFEGHEEDLLIYMTTDTASGKFEQIKANPKASVYFCDPKQIKGLLLVGEIEVITDMAIKRQLWQDDWKVYYPGGVDGPEYNILRLLPKHIKYWAVPMPKPVEMKLV